MNHEFLKFEIRNENVKKQMGLYEIENINNKNICTIAINWKEYFEKFKNRSINKKHKGIRHDSPGMNFESYAYRIKVLKEVNSECAKKNYAKKIKS